MKEKFMRFMQGRCMADQLSKGLLGVGFALAILSIFISSELLSLVVVAILAYVYFRMFSRNTSKRYSENQKFLKLTGGLRRSVGKEKHRIQQKKIYRYYKCPACTQEVRVPRGKGKIEISCPKCQVKFVKRS